MSNIRTLSLKSLHDLFVSLFGTSEAFRQWISLRFDNDRILAAFPSSGPVSAVIFSGLEALRRSGLINSEFFEHLAEDYPARAEEISYIQRIWHERSYRPQSYFASMYQEQQPAKVWRIGSLSLAAVLVIAAAYSWHKIRPTIEDVYACTIRCTGCKGLARGWIVLETGETYIVDITTGAIRFHCIPEGTKISVVLELSDGQHSLMFITADIVVDVDSITIPLSRFTPGTPPGFSPETAQHQSGSLGKANFSLKGDAPAVVSPKRDSGAPPLNEEYAEARQLDGGAKEPLDTSNPGMQHLQLLPRSGPPARPVSPNLKSLHEATDGISSVASTKTPCDGGIFMPVNGGARDILTTLPGDVYVTITQRSRCNLVRLYIDDDYKGLISDSWEGTLKPGIYTVRFDGDRIRSHTEKFEVPSDLSPISNKLTPAYNKTITWEPVISSDVDIQEAFLPTNK